MNIPLDQFEQIIDDTIVKRGLAYFKKGAVVDLTEISKGEYEAIVSGTEDYIVYLTIENNTIIEHDCDCPYDRGSVCKHVVAVIFKFLQEELDFRQSDANSQLTLAEHSHIKEKSDMQQIKELLKYISKDELMEFVTEQCKKDNKFRNAFLLSFGHLSQNKSKEFYQKQIRSILKTAAGKDGYIGLSDMRYLVNSIQILLNSADESLQKQDFPNVFIIGSALLEEMIEAFKYGDDSNGELGYFVDSAMELIVKLTKAGISRPLKREIFEYCILVFKRKIFSGWDWSLDILRIAGDLIENENDADIIVSCLELFKGDYLKECAQSYKLELLSRFKAPKVVEEFIRQNISNPIFRRLEIEKAFKRQDYERARSLAEDGIICDEPIKPGLVKDWHDWLLKIASIQNDIPHIIKYARYMLFKDFRSSQDYYQILKDTIEPEKWHSFLEEIIREAILKEGLRHQGLIRFIYIKEEWWDRLLLLLKQNLTLESIKKNDQYLARDHSAELVELYSDQLIIFVDNSRDRFSYQIACGYLQISGKQ